MGEKPRALFSIVRPSWIFFPTITPARAFLVLNGDGTRQACRDMAFFKAREMTLHAPRLFAGEWFRQPCGPSPCSARERARRTRHRSSDTSVRQLLAILASEYHIDHDLSIIILTINIFYNVLTSVATDM
jgi:hypothetical protein